MDPSLDGVNQWETISTGAGSSRNEFVYNINDVQNRSAIRVGKYKLMQGIQKHSFPRKGANVFRLFDLENDPFEHEDIAEQRKDIAKELKNRLDFYRQTQVHPVIRRRIKAFNRDCIRLNLENVTPGWC